MCFYEKNGKESTRESTVIAKRKIAERIKK